jgi:hypothetical protein
MVCESSEMTHKLMLRVIAYGLVCCNRLHADATECAGMQQAATAETGLDNAGQGPHRTEEGLVASSQSTSSMVANAASTRGLSGGAERQVTGDPGSPRRAPKRKPVTM